MEILNKEDLKQTYTIQVCESINPVLDDIVSELNNLLMGYFNSERVSNALFRRYRGRYIGFNNTFSIEFLIYLYWRLQNQDNVLNVIKPHLNDYIINESLKKLTKNDVAHNRTIKISPYIRNILSKTKGDLNDKLEELFSEEVIEGCFHRDLRGKYHKPFTYHYMIDFLIYLFNQIKLNEIDLVNFIIPTMDSFLREKEKTIIREE